jgi:hypothetical protein
MRNRLRVQAFGQTYGSGRERYAALLADPANAHLTFIRLTSLAAARRFLRTADA